MTDSQRKRMFISAGYSVLDYADATYRDTLLVTDGNLYAATQAAHTLDRQADQWFVASGWNRLKMDLEL